MAEQGSPRITVLGTGYLGATHAVCMAELGYEVLGLDVDETKVARLSAGDLPFFEPELPELLSKNLASGRLRFTTSYAEVAAFGDIHFICVGTPQQKGEYAADLSYVTALTDGSFAGTRIAVLGASFKPNSDDVRDSPALDIAAACTGSGPRYSSTTRSPWTTRAGFNPN